MSATPLQGLKETHQALIVALDANDIDAIEAATAALSASIARVRDAGDPQLGLTAAADAAELRQLSDQARMRVNFLTDQVRGRLERFAAAGGRGRTALYSREGR